MEVSWSRFSLLSERVWVRVSECESRCQFEYLTVLVSVVTVCLKNLIVFVSVTAMIEVYLEYENLIRVLGSVDT